MFDKEDIIKLIRDETHRLFEEGYLGSMIADMLVKNVESTIDKKIELMQAEQDNIEIEIPKKYEPRVTYSEDGLYAYFNGHKYKKATDKKYFRRVAALHIDVAEFYRGEAIPEGYEVHHAGKDENGIFDASKNDIEFLRVLTKEQHQAIHKRSYKTFSKKIEFVCEWCGKKTVGFDYGRERKPRFCSKECYTAYQGRNKDTETICPVCGNKFTAPTFRKQIYCSRKCAALARKRNENGQMS